MAGNQFGDQDGEPFMASAEVMEASRVISVQVHCTLDEAFALMKGRAEANRISLQELAHSVIIRQTRFG